MIKIPAHSGTEHVQPRHSEPAANGGNLLTVILQENSHGNIMLPEAGN